MAGKATERDRIAVLVPDGGLQLEWETADTAFGKSRTHLQDELYRCFVSDPEGWLLRPGLAETKVPLSASMSYWREFAGQFTRRLIRTPGQTTASMRPACMVKAESLSLKSATSCTRPTTGASF